VPNLSGPVINRTSVARLHRSATPGCLLSSPQSNRPQWQTDAKRTQKTWTDCRHGSIMRWIATRQKSRGRGAPGRPQRIGLSRAPERKRKLQREKRTDLHTNSQAICLCAANNARRSWNDWSAKRRLALHIEAPLYIFSWVHAEADINHGSNSCVIWRNEEESDRGTAGTTPKRGGRKRQKTHTRQVVPASL
jgi:hypothetical protein